MDKGKVEEDNESTSMSLSMLPEGCIADILALTSPPDVCRLSLVSTSLRSAANSDFVWAKFLPSDYPSIIAKSPTPTPDFRSLKDLYAYLSDHPLLIDEGRKIFSLEKETGKKCYFLGARDLNIVWSETPDYWDWISLPESRFPEVAYLILVWWLEIWVTIRAGILSPSTSYKAYFVYKFEDYARGFDIAYMDVSVGISGVESKNVRVVSLHPDPVPKHMSLHPDNQHISEAMYDGDQTDSDQNKPIPKLRDDGWFELELGELFTENEDDCIELRIQEVKSGCIKQGLIVEGIELRPGIA